MAKVIDDKRPLPDYNVIELLRHMAVEICDKYCKYPDRWDPDIMGYDLCESEICANCPLVKML